MGQPRVGVAAEVALADPAVLGPVEQCAVGLQLPDPVGGLLGVQFGHPPVVEELAATHGVGEVHLPVVLGVGVAHRRGAAALGHHGVRLAEQGLGHHGDLQAALARLDHRAQTRSRRRRSRRRRTDAVRSATMEPRSKSGECAWSTACQPMNLRSEMAPLATSMM